VDKLDIARGIARRRDFRELRERRATPCGGRRCDFRANRCDLCERALDDARRFQIAQGERCERSSRKKPERNRRCASASLEHNRPAVGQEKSATAQLRYRWCDRSNCSFAARLRPTRDLKAAIVKATLHGSLDRAFLLRPLHARHAPRSSDHRKGQQDDGCARKCDAAPAAGDSGGRSPDSSGASASACTGAERSGPSAGVQLARGQ
jgi:hypothetical protein